MCSLSPRSLLACGCCAATVRSMSRSGDRRELLRGPLVYGIIFILSTLFYWRQLTGVRCASTPNPSRPANTPRHVGVYRYWPSWSCVPVMDSQRWWVLGGAGSIALARCRGRGRSRGLAPVHSLLLPLRLVRTLPNLHSSGVGPRRASTPHYPALRWWLCWRHLLRACLLVGTT